MRFRCALALACVALASCGHERRDVRVTLHDTCGLTDGADCQQGDAVPEACSSYCSRLARWANLAIFEGRCPDRDALLRGDLSGAIRVVQGRAGSTLPSIGELDDERYGFAGIFRASDCAIVGIGCSEVDLSEQSTVRIEMLPAIGSGLCTAGHVCQEGVCTSSEAASDEATCTPVLVASGALPEPKGNARAVGVGLVATDSGYLAAYREDDADGSLRIRILPIEKDGQLGEGFETRIEHCGSASEAGLAMALSLEGGLLATTLAPCENQGAGAAFVAFAHDGAILDTKRFAGAGQDLRITHRSLASGPGPNDFELVYTAAGSAYRLRLAGAQPHASYEALFPEATTSFAQVASLGDDVARLVGSEAAIHVGVGSWEASPRLTRLEGSALASLAVHGGRVVVTRSTSGGLAWEGRTSSGASFGDGSFTTGQAIAAVDIAIAKGVAILGAAHATGIHVLPLGDMRRELAAEPKLVVQHALSEGASSLVMASQKSRFGVAWLRGGEGKGPIGGYALFDCAR